MASVKGHPIAFQSAAWTKKIEMESLFSVL
jgi:hypothetical protein